MNPLVTWSKVKENIALIKLNRPEAANAMSTPLLNELNQVIKEVDEDKSIYCTIITGEGEKAFCAGADLKERKTMTESEVIKAVRYIGDTVQALENLRTPVIAAINGVAFGGGLELALACDIRIIRKDTKVGLTETSLAIIPGAGGTQRLPRLIGIGQAKKVIYTATPIHAEEAYSLGIAEEMVDKENVLNKALEIATKIAKNGPIAIEQAKLAINHGIETDLRTGLTIEHLAYQKTIPTKDRMEGLIAFNEKRSPIYKGE